VKMTLVTEVAAAVVARSSAHATAAANAHAPDPRCRSRSSRTGSEDSESRL